MMDSREAYNDMFENVLEDRLKFISNNVSAIDYSAIPIDKINMVLNSMDLAYHAVERLKNTYPKKDEA